MKKLLFAMILMAGQAKALSTSYDCKTDGTQPFRIQLEFETVASGLIQVFQNFNMFEGEFENDSHAHDGTRLAGYDQVTFSAGMEQDRNAMDEQVTIGGVLDLDPHFHKAFGNVSVYLAGVVVELHQVSCQ